MTEEEKEAFLEAEKEARVQEHLAKRAEHQAKHDTWERLSEEEKQALFESKKAELISRLENLTTTTTTVAPLPAENDVSTAVQPRLLQDVDAPADTCELLKE